MTTYGERLAEERAHLSDEAVIERALERIAVDEREKAAMVKRLETWRPLLTAVVEALDDQNSGASMMAQRLYLLLPQLREALRE